MKSDFRRFAIVAKANEAEIYLYDEIGQTFWGDGISAKQFAEEFKGIGKVSRILLHINSPGGDVFDGAAIYDLITASKIPVDVQVDGIAASAAFTVAMAGRKISIGEAGLMMMHNAKALAVGDASDMRQTADVIDKISDQMAGIYAKRSKKSLEEIKQLMDDETWMTAEESVTRGFADEVMPKADEEDEAAKMAASFDLSKFKRVPEAFKMRIAAIASVADRRLATAMTSSGSPEITTATAVTKEKVMAEATSATAPAVVDAHVGEDLATKERERCSAINQLGKENSIDVQAWIDNETPLSEVKMAVADAVLSRAKRDAKAGGLAHPTISALTERERRDYSIRRAVMSQLNDRDHEEAGLEWEVSKAIAKDLKMTPKGVFIPMQLRPQASGLDTKTDAAGKYLVATEVRELLPLLRNRAMVIRAGAEVLSGLTSSISFPRELTATAASWVAQNPGSDLSESDGTFGNLALTPKSLAGTTSFTRELMVQASLDIENHIRTRLATAHALAIDLAAIAGTGDNNQPTGILNTDNIGDVTAGGSGSVPDFGDCVDLETKIAVANADADGMAYLTTPEIRGVLRQKAMLNDTYGTIPVWSLGPAAGTGNIMGYPAYVSNQVPKTLTASYHALIFGWFPSLIIAEFGVMDVVADPYSKKKQGLIEITSYQLVDLGIRQVGAFAAKQDCKLS